MINEKIRQDVERLEIPVALERRSDEQYFWRVILRILDENGFNIVKNEDKNK